jgi:hypothetical protein
MMSWSLFTRSRLGTSPRTVDSGSLASVCMVTPGVWVPDRRQKNGHDTRRARTTSSRAVLSALRHSDVLLLHGLGSTSEYADKTLEICGALALIFLNENIDYTLLTLSWLRFDPYLASPPCLSTRSEYTITLELGPRRRVELEVFSLDPVHLYRRTIDCVWLAQCTFE